MRVSRLNEEKLDRVRIAESKVRIAEKRFKEALIELERLLKESNEKRKVTKLDSSQPWSNNLSYLKELLKVSIEVTDIEFTEENVKKLGTYIQSPIEEVYLGKIGKETQFDKINRKKGSRRDIDRRLLLDAIPKVIKNPAFIIETKYSQNENRHLYFKSAIVKNKKYILMFVVSLQDTSKPKLISFQNVDDIYKKIKEGDFVLFEDGRKTRVKLQKATSNL